MVEKALSEKGQGMGLALSGFFIFSIGDVIAKWQTLSYSLMHYAFFATLGSVAVLLLLSPLMGGIRKTLASDKLGLHLIRGLIFSAQYLTIVYAFSRLPMATAYAMIFAAPLISTALSIPLFREQAGLRRWLVILSGFAGVLIILRPGMLPLDPGMIAVCASAALFAVGSLMARYIGKGETPLSFAIFPPVLTACFTGLYLGVQDKFILPPPGDLSMMIAGGLCSAFGMLCLAYAFLKAPVAAVAPFHYSQIIWGSVFGLLIFGDIPGLWTYIGSAVIIASGLHLIFMEKTRPAQRMPAGPADQRDYQE